MKTMDHTNSALTKKKMPKGNSIIDTCAAAMSYWKLTDFFTTITVSHTYIFRYKTRDYNLES